MSWAGLGLHWLCTWVATLSVISNQVQHHTLSLVGQLVLSSAVPFYDLDDSVSLILRKT